MAAVTGKHVAAIDGCATPEYIALKIQHVRSARSRVQEPQTECIRALARLPLCSGVVAENYGILDPPTRQALRTRLADLERFRRLRSKLGDAELRARRPADEHAGAAECFASVLPCPEDRTFLRNCCRDSTSGTSSCAGLVPEAAHCVELTEELLRECDRLIGGSAAGGSATNESSEPQPQEPTMAHLPDLGELLGASRAARRAAEATGLSPLSDDEDIDI